MKSCNTGQKMELISRIFQPYRVKRRLRVELNKNYS